MQVLFIHLCFIVSYLLFGSDERAAVIEVMIANPVDIVVQTFHVYRSNLLIKSFYHSKRSLNLSLSLYQLFIQIGWFHTCQLRLGRCKCSTSVRLNVEIVVDINKVGDWCLFWDSFYLDFLSGSSRLLLLLLPREILFVNFFVFFFVLR